MVLTTVPTTALTVHAETDGDNTEIVTETEIDPSDLDENQDENVPDDSNSELSDEEKAAAKDAVANAKSKAESAKSKAESAQIKQEATDAQNLLDEAKTELAKAPEDTDGYGDAKAAIEAAAGVVNEKISSDLPEQLPETPEGNGGQEEGQKQPTDASAMNNLDTATTASFDEEDPYAMQPAENTRVIEAQAVTVDNKTTYTDLSDAVIRYENGCVEDGVVKANASKIEFTVTPATGKKVTAVKYFLADTEDGFTGNGTNATPSGAIGDLNTVYSVSTNIATLEKNKKLVRIAVTVDDVVYHVSFDKSATAVSSAVVYKRNEADGKFDLAGGNAIDNPVDVKYNETLDFAVKLAGFKADNAKVAAKKGAGNEQKLEGTDGKLADNTEYVWFTVNPATVEGALTTKDDNISVVLDKNAVIRINTQKSPADTVTVDTANVELDVRDLKGGVAAYTSYKKLQRNQTAVNYSNTDKVYFGAAVKDPTEYKLVFPTAYFVTTSGDPAEETDRVKLEVKQETLRDADDATYPCYVIDLSPATESGFLYVDIQAVLDDTKDSVKTITFAANTDAKATKNAADIADDTKKSLLGGSDKTTSDVYKFNVKANVGFEVEKVEVETAKIYTDTEGGSRIVTETVGTDGLKLAENSDLYPFDVTKEFSVQLSGKDPADAENNIPERPWIARSAKVTVTTTPLELAADTDVKFLSNGNYGTGTSKPQGAYTFKVNVKENEVQLKDEEQQVYTVKKGASYLEFTVEDAETDPEIKVHGEDLAQRVEGEGYTYRIPAASLLSGKTNSVYIGRKAKTVTVNYNGAGEVTDIAVKDEKFDDVAIAVSPDGSYPLGSEYSHKATATVNVDATVIITGKAKAKTVLSAVTYQVGKDDAPKPVTLKADGSFEIKVKATDDVTVNVDKSTDSKLEVYKNGDYSAAIKPGDDGVYEVNYNEAVTAQVLNGRGVALPLQNASVKEDGKNAESSAKIETRTAARDLATLVFDKSEYNKDLEVTLIALDGEKQITKTFTVRTLSQFDGVTYGSEIASDGTLTLSVDTEVKTGVTTNAENNKISNLVLYSVSETAKDAKSGTEAVPDGTTGIPTVTAGNVKAELAGDELTITALPNGGKGKAKAARFVLVDSASGADKKIVAGSSILVSTTDATVTGREPVLEKGVSTAKEITVHLTAPEGLETDLKTGKVWYKVVVTKPSVTGLDNDTKEALRLAFNGDVGEDADGSANTITRYVEAWAGESISEQIQVMADVIGTAPNDKAFRGAAVTGFKVKATLVQATAGKAASDAAANTAVAGGSKEIETETQEPFYANTEIGKLSLKTGKTTINTGDPTDVVVATPDFGKDARYTNVKAEFVDTKTGIAKTLDYGKYYGMETWYDLASNTVRVRFANAPDAATTKYADNIRDGRYNDLGVKVTAVTEYSGYGVSGTVKIKVVNGIEQISASAQPFVKFEGKKVTFKVNTVLNHTEQNPKYAPAKKTLDYEIVPATGTVLPSNIAGAVTVKNGTVTVDKNFVVDKNPVNNRFKVRVWAADYAWNERYDDTGVIEISNESRAMGGMVIMKPGKDGDWSKAEIVASGTGAKLEVTKAVGEYRAVVLQSDVNANKQTFDVAVTSAQDGSTDAVPYGQLDIAPNKGNIVVDPANGDIKVNKLGKANFTATDRSDKKNKKDNLKKIEFVATTQNVELELVQLADSANLTAKDTFYGQNVEYTGKATTMFGVNVIRRDKDNKPVEVSVSDAKLTFKKNIKNVTPKNPKEWEKYGDTYQYLIAVNGNPGTMVLTRKNQGSQEYTLTNTNVITAKAPKVENVNKKQKVVQGITTTLYYRVSEKSVPSFEGKHVVLSIDNTKKNPDNIRDAFKERIYDESGNIIETRNYLDRTIAIREGGVFDFVIGTGKAETYYLNAAVGSLAGGEFTQEYADAKVTVKVSKKGSVNLKVDSKYSLDPQTASRVKIGYNEKDAPAWFVDTDGNESIYEGTPEKYNWARNAIIGNTENKFRDYFEAKTDSDGHLATIGIRADLTEAQISDAMAILSDKKSQDRIGYITVSNGSKQIDVKITLDYKSFEKSLKGTADNVIQGPNMSVNIKLYNGKNYMAVEDYEFVDNQGFTKPKAPNHLTKNEETGESDIHLTGNMISDGTHKVVLKVTLADRCANVKNKTVQVTVPVKVEKASAKNKVNLTKDKNVWSFTHKDWVGPTVNNEQGSWTKTVPYTFKNALSAPEETPVTVTSDAPYVSFTSDVYMTGNKTQKLTVVLDKAKLAAAIAGTKSLDWGKKVNVKATFAYGDAKHVTNLEKDTVTINITLPGTPSAGADANTFKAVENSIRNLVEIQTAYNKDNAPTDGNAERLTRYKNECNEELKAKIEDRLNEAAGGASVTITVSYTAGGDGYANVFTATVTSGQTTVYNGEFQAVQELDLTDIITSIKTYSSWATGTVTWANAKGDEEVQDLVTLTKDTDTTAYAKMIRSILEKKGEITNNFGISVRLQENGFKAPTVPAGSNDGTGYYNVTVKVIDKNKAPSLGVNRYYAELNMDYAFKPMEAVGDDTTGAVKRITDKLDGTDDANATVINIVDEAWKNAATVGMKFTDEKFYEEVKKSILSAVEKMIAEGGTNTSANTNLKVTGIEEGSFDMAVNASSQLTKLEYTLLLSDATPGAEKSEISIPISVSGTIAVPSFQTEDGLKTAITAYDLYSISYVNTEKAAEDAIKAVLLKECSKNGAYDTSKLEVKAAENSFVKPEGNKDGVITVNVKVDKDDKDEVATTFTNVIILAENKDALINVPDTDVEKAAKTAYAKAKSRVIAAMNQEALLYQVNELIKDKADGTPATKITEDDVKVMLEEIATSALAGLYDVDNSGTPGGGITPSESIAIPNEWSDSFVIPSFTVAIKADTDGINVAVPAATPTIPVPSVRLGKLDKMQSFDKAKTEMMNAVKTLEIGNIALTETTSGTTLTGFDPDSESALKAAIIEELKAKNIVTNPLVKIKEVTLDADPDPTYEKTGLAAKYQYKVTGWNVVLEDQVNTDDGGDKIAAEISIDALYILTAESTPKVTGIEFVTIGGETVKATDQGDGASTEVAITADDSENGDTVLPITVNVTTTEPVAGNASYQELDWLVAKNGESDADNAQEIVVRDDGNGGYELFIPKEAKGDVSKHFSIDIKATAKKTQPGKAAVTNTANVQLTLNPTLVDAYIEGPDTIELDSTHKFVGTAQYTLKYADAYHLLDDQDTAAWGGTAKETAGGKYYEEAAGTTEVTAAKKASVYLQYKTAVDTENRNKSFTITATPNITDATTVTKTITLSAYDESNDPKLTLIGLNESTAKLDEDLEYNDTTFKRLTVTGKEVQIPLSIEGADGRTWAYSIEDKSGAGDLISLYGSDEAGAAADGSVDVGAIGIVTSGKNAKLVIKNTVKASDTPDVTYNADGDTITADGTKKIVITATGTAAGKSTVTATLELALVVKESVDTMKLYSVTSDADQTHSPATDDGVTAVNVDKSDSVCLYPEFAGTHVDQSNVTKAKSLVTYRLRKNPYDGLDAAHGVALTHGTNGTATIAVGANVAVSGTVIVEAIYKNGTIRKTASRALYVNAGDATGSITVEGNISSLDIATTDTKVTKTLTLTEDVNPVTNASWSLKNVSPDLRDYCKIEKVADDYKLAIYADKAGYADNVQGLPEAPLKAGSYNATIVAEWLTANKSVETVEKTITIVVKAKVTSIKVTGVTKPATDGADLKGTPDLTNPAAATATVVTGTAGTLTVNAELVGDRIDASNNKNLSYSIAANDAKITTVTVGTSAASGATVTVPADAVATKTADVVFALDNTDKTWIEDATPAASAKLTITIEAAPVTP